MFYFVGVLSELYIVLKEKIFFDINIVIILLVNFGKDNYKLLNNGNLMCLFIMYRYDIIVFFILFLYF